MDRSPIEIPIDGVLDLHAFNPKELSDLLDDYLMACHQKGLTSVRIIHGKGTGMLKARVQSLLSRHPLVVGFKEASGESGGWGATVAKLRCL